MSLTLKLYQQTCLAKLDEFLRLFVQSSSAPDAFFSISHRQYLPIPGLDNFPPRPPARPHRRRQTLRAAYPSPFVP